MKKIKLEALLFSFLVAAAVFSVGALFPKTASANEPSSSPTTTAGSTTCSACMSFCASGNASNCAAACSVQCATSSTNPAPTTPVVSGGTTFTNPLAFTTVEDFLGNFLTVMLNIIVTLALVFIVIGAIMYVTSAGDSKRIESAKQAITAALIGLAIGIGAPSILKQLSVILGWNTTNNATVNKALTFSQIATNLLTFLLGIFGVLAIIMMVIGGIMYLTSAGEEDRIDSGKKIFKYAIIGTIVAMAAMVLVRQIAVFFT